MPLRKVQQMEKLSVFVTTFNNAETLDRCLSSVSWADEMVVLDSFSTDDTLAIARHHGCQIHQRKFRGYGAQKQMALEHTSNNWVLLLDADEMLSSGLQKEIQALLESGLSAAGYALPRREQVFWRMNHPGVRLNYHLRLFDKRRGRLSDMPVHAAPKVEGKVERLTHPFFHFGERDIHEKVDKINAYSTGLVAEKLARGRRVNPLVLIFYPPWAFFRSYVLKRAFLDGWAGFIASVVMSFYAFLRYAKLYEHGRRARDEPTVDISSPPDRNARV
ncbi:MAG: glycosyltransferase family 2 protein [Gammaproteobacteria bacterium]|nr:glycosyltransferase family 2 protein [Gammaproteobacteria bacterium]